MNRQIKFRIWNSKTSEWVHGPGKEVNLFGEMILLGGFMKNIPLTDWDDCVILQFTGLKDSTGVEIYEGDILEELHQNESVKGIGICKQVLGGWSIFSADGSHWHGWKQKIIGNIYENKELI
jgi:uncharacterized phage protein (TIGR01671 family)